jgi:hypothetical protein
MPPSNEDENLSPAGHRSHGRLREIAQQLGQPVEQFYGPRSDDAMQLQELLRLWHAITDPAGRRRVLDLARQEARWSGHQEGG